jgi:hypothetical protein
MTLRKKKVAHIWQFWDQTSIPVCPDIKQAWPSGQDNQQHVAWMGTIL